MHLKKKKCVGRKFSKVRLTELAVGNDLGRKLRMFITEKANKPKNLKRRLCSYSGQTKGWVDNDLFEEWVHEQDRKFECQNRKVLLIVYNFPAHPDVGGLKAIDLCFLPLSATTITQPMDECIIRYL